MIVDIIIAILLVVALVRGSGLGLVRQFFSTAGFFFGIFIGALVTPYFINMADSSLSRLILTVIITLTFAIIFLGFGELIGVYLKRRLDGKIMEKIDSGIGSLAGGVTLLVTVWLVAAVMMTLPFAGLKAQLGHSYFINQLDSSLPAAPSVIAKIGYLMNPNGFPRVFLGREPTPPKNLTSQGISGKLRAQVKEVSKSVVKVEGLGCGGLVEGSGFVVGQDLVATNAHVVAGITKPYVVDDNGHHQAKAVLFDPDLDFAVLNVDNLAGPPLMVSDRLAGKGTVGAVLGYPNGGALEADSAVVTSNFTAIGRNIYNQGTTRRLVLGLDTKIEHGNSGGPLIARDGSVIGVVFAKSTTYKRVGYALAASKIKAGLSEANASTSPVSTGQCAG